jgi:hypothetical protein
MTIHKTIRIDDDLAGAITSIQMAQHRKSWSETAAHLLAVGVENEGMIHFNKACTLMGITWQRESFSKWRQANEVPPFATLSEWENYAAEFETDGDTDDLHNTQRDALR